MTQQAPSVPTLRLVTVDDAHVLADLARANREFLKPWEPTRDDAHFTVGGQRHALESALARHRQHCELPCAIVEGDEVIGRITLSNLVRGPFQSSDVGYWVSQAHNGRGVATAALRQAMTIAFDGIGLHRIQAGTLVHNVASQRALEKAGFTRIGLAPAYLRIGGEWQDHVLYQALSQTAS